MIKKIIARAELDMLRRTLAALSEDNTQLTCILMLHQAERHRVLGPTVARKYRRQMRAALGYNGVVEQLFIPSTPPDWNLVSRCALAWRIGYLTKKIEQAEEVLNMHK